jgi:predicted transcriptional regulator
MGIVWKLGECSSSEVIAENNKRDPRAETTIRTVLTNLREKGYVELVPTVERQFRFRPSATQEDIGRQSLKDLVSRLFGDSPRQALMYLINDEDISDEDIEVLRKQIDERKRKGGQP